MSASNCHNFRNDLAQSKEDLLRIVPLQAVIRTLFPNVTEIVDLETDLTLQLAGADYILESSAESWIYLEVKNQKREDMPRLPVELWSSWRREKPPPTINPYTAGPGFRRNLGWAVKPMLAEFLLMNVLPRRESWLVRLDILQSVTRRNYDKWMERAMDPDHAWGYYYRPSKNPTYNTWNICIPFAHYEEAFSPVRIIKWDSLPPASHGC